MRFTYKCITRWLPPFARVPNYAPICCHMHPVHNCPSHKIMSSTCQTIHYDAWQYRVYIPVYNFVFVIPKSQWKGPRWQLFCALYTVYWPVSSSGYLPWSFPPSLSPFLPRSSPSFRCFLPPPLASSLLRSLPPSSLSLAPSMPKFLPHSFTSSTLPPVLLHLLNPSSSPASPPQPFLQSCFTSSTLPPVLLHLLNPSSSPASPPQPFLQSCFTSSTLPPVLLHLLNPSSSPASPPQPFLQSCFTSSTLPPVLLHLLNPSSSPASPPQPFLQSCFTSSTLPPVLLHLLNPSSSPASTLPHIIASSLPHIIASSLPPLPPSLPSSILPCLSACRRPIQCTPYVCLASCTVLGCSRQKKVSFQWPAVTFSERAPTTNPFWMKSKKIRRTTRATNDTNTVDARTFPWVSAATPRAF